MSKSKEASEDKAIGHFAFSLTFLQKSNGNFHTKSKIRSKGIPLEIVFAQMKVFLKAQEEDYFNNYKKSLNKEDEF